MRLLTLIRGSLLAAVLLQVACGGGSAQVNGSDAGSQTPGEGTCTESSEVCDGADNDCDGRIDEDFDIDGDGVTTCAGDCNDLHAGVFPGAEDPAKDCDENTTTSEDGGVIHHDDPSQPGDDDDADGFLFPDDCNDRNASVGPGAIEVIGDGVDNDCDSATSDTIPEACDPADTATAASAYAQAIGLCTDHVTSAAFMTGAEFVSGTHAKGPPRKIRAKFGSYWEPRQGTNMIHLSSGVATDRIENSSYSTQNDGTRYGVTGTHPAWSKSLCGGITPVTQAKDMTELKLTLKVPQNANSFSFDFNFFSSEYPEWHCSQYNDRFVALLTSEKYAGNVSFDKSGQAISVNNKNFSICESSDDYVCSKESSLAKNEYTGFGVDVGGSTDWLTTQAPVTPGETITLRLVILDEGDDKFDSAVIVDNFKWQTFKLDDDAPTTDPVIN